MLIPIDPTLAVVAFLPLVISAPVFLLLKKTILKNDVPANNPGPTPKRLLALAILLVVHLIPVVILYHFLVSKVWW